MKTFTVLIGLLIAGSGPSFGQNFTEILGRPTDSSVTMSILFDLPCDVYWEYGTVPGSYPMATDTIVADSGIPVMRDFSNLVPDARYYYRTRYRLSGSGGAFGAGQEHSFHTSRPAGASFTFAVEADPHLDTNSNTAAYSLTLQNIQAKSPDFMFDLGDTFMSEKLTSQTQGQITARHLLYRGYFGQVCHSVPLYFVLGNHEGELGWRLDGTASCLPVMASNTRKLYYPNPIPDSFYSGDTIPEPYVGLRGNYYAWEWGDALFIVMEPYWYTVSKPGWGWTLGEDQYNWFRNVITSSKAKFKFVFCHQLVGGNGNDSRGGVEYVPYYEMGGFNADSTWGFDTYRPGWGKTIHQLMVDNKASVYFHGHDHCYARQEKDGIIYQEVPQPSSRNITNITGTQYGYVQGILLPSRGFCLVTVTDSTAKVDYIRTFLPGEQTGGHTNGEIAYSYTIRPENAGIDEKGSRTGSFELGQNYPDPFSDKTTIHYRIITASYVRLSVFNMYGQEVALLDDLYRQPGDYTVDFCAGSCQIPPGIYYYRLALGSESKCMKMIHIH